MRTRILAAIAVSSGLFAAPASANAAVIFANLGPGDTFDIFSYGFGRAPGVQHGYAGSAFIAPGTFRLDDLTTAVNFFYNPPPASTQPFDILVLSSSPEGRPASILESFEE